MKYAMMTYKESIRTFNTGDYIQSLAAEQFLPHVDALINREKLGQYTGEQAKIILNGWFTHDPDTWMPSEKLTPLFVSFHINSSAASRLLSPEGINYLKKHEPIGCRDHYTVRILKEKGINAYFTGCLTLTLDSYADKSGKRDDKIYIVDTLYGFPNKERIYSGYRSFIKAVITGDIFHTNAAHEIMKKIFTENLLKNAEYITQEPASNRFNEDEKFAMAKDVLKKYSTAKFVITSRIHCALPCLAMGTPVIYINGFESEFDACRMEGLVDLFHTINVNRKTGKVSANFDLKGLIDENFSLENKDTYLKLANDLKKTVQDFILEN